MGLWCWGSKLIGAEFSLLLAKKADITFQALLLTTQNAYLENPEMMGFTPLPKDIISEEVFPDHYKCCDYWFKVPSLKTTFALFTK